jgi:periplasmic divalent cation tolerance protein
VEPKGFQVQVVLRSQLEARELLHKVVGARLTVAAKIIGPFTSVLWDDGIKEELDKWLIVAMVTRGRVHDLTRRIQELYPDSAAEIIVLPVVGGSDQYLDWVMTRTW